MDNVFWFLAGVGQVLLCCYIHVRAYNNGANDVYAALTVSVKEKK